MEAAGLLDYERPTLYPKQEEAIFNASRYAFIEASTKSGKTTGCLAWILEEAILGGDNWNHWWIAPVLGQAKIAYERLKGYLPRNIYKSNDTDSRLKLSNGANIWFKSGEKPDNLYGEDVYSAVVDEASRVREESWHAVRSTLTATRGPCRLIGNVKGKGNWFYKLCRNAEHGQKNTHYTKLTAYDAVDGGVLDLEEIEDAKRLLPADVFKELYLAEALDNYLNPFGAEFIRKCISPLSQNETVVWGWDLAKSVDWTVGIGLDKDGNVTQFERFQGPWEATVKTIHRVTGTTDALIDGTGVGDPVLEQLQDGYNNYQGYKFTQVSKQQLMEGLAISIQRDSITFPEGIIVDELMSYEYYYTPRGGVSYSAPSGMHDDAVCSLALANHHLTHQPIAPMILF